MASAEQRPSLSQRRRSSLTALQMPSPSTISWEPVQVDLGGGLMTQDVIEEGQELFQHFIEEELHRESPEKCIELLSSNHQGFTNPSWAKTGRDLRLLADEFARTKERERVRERANEVNIEITYEEFRALLTQLFMDEVTNERIIVLFYFCSDIAIRSIQRGTRLFQQFLNWSLQFITEKVCSWVERQGGWGQVLKSPFNSVKKALFWISVTLVIIGTVRFLRGRS